MATRPDAVARVSVFATDARAAMAAQKKASDLEEGRISPDMSKSKQGDVAPVQPHAVPFLQLFKYAERADKWMMAIGLLAATVTGAIQPAFTIIFGQLINAFGDPGVDLQAEINKYVLYLVYLSAVAFVAAYIEVALLNWSGGRQANQLRKAYLRSLLRQEIAWFDTKAGTGKVLQALNDDTQAFQTVIGDHMGAFTRDFVNFIAALGVAFWRGWDMTLVILATMPFLVGAGMGISVITGRLQALVNSANNKANTHAQQALSNIRTIASYGLEEPTADKYEQMLNIPEAAGIKQATLNGLTLGCTSGIFFFSYALAMWYGAGRVADGAYTGGYVMTVLFAGVGAGFALGQAMPHLQYFERGRVGAAALFSVISKKPLIDIDAPGTVLPEIRGDIELEHVSFSYPARPDRKIFNGFNLTIPAGKTIALVGKSGSGKSTIVQLVERFYDPDAGQVLLDGHNLKSLQLGWLRSQISLVSQEPTLFNTTIFKNIASSNPAATQDEVIAAATAANAHGFITRLPDGYGTMVGEKGTQLSGGQRQRIAIARAILRDPRILLLDEATSALDAQSEAAVQSALENLMAGRTTIVVAHRLSTIVNADIIAVVRGGKIVEQGKHADLLNIPGGFYSQLVAHQQLEATDGEGEAESSEARVSGKRKVLRQSVLSRASVRLSVIPQDILKKLKGRQAPAAASTQNSVSYKRLIRMNRPEWGYGISGAFSSAALGFQMPGFVLALAGIINVFFEPTPDDIRQGGSKWGIVFTGIGIGTIMLSVLQGWCFGVMGQRLARRVRQLLFKSMLRQDMGWFDKEENSSGQLVSKLSTDAAAVRGAVGDQIGIILQNLSTIIASYAIAFYSSWSMALVVSAVLPLTIFSQYNQTKMMTGQFRQDTEAVSRANQLAAEAMGSIRVVAAYTLQEDVSTRYSQGVGGTRNILNAQIQAMSCGFAQFMQYAVICLAFWYGGTLVNAGKINFPDMLRAFYAINFVALSLSQANLQFPDMGKAQAAVQRVFSIIDAKPDVDSERPGAELALDGEVELKDVTFAYPARPNRLVFKHFNLHIPAGTSCALVGESGHGKSTIIGLLERFYDVVDGQVLLDGVPIQNLSLKCLRSQIGLVGQEPVMFSASILENIMMGNSHATLAQVVDAAKAAHALDFIERLPEQFDTKLGDGGIQLSGGQKQRIAIARAVLRDPKILMLDEATSALDSESEKIVQTALDELMVSRTTIIVAHRLSTIRSATKIAAVYRGRVLEQGTYDELMKLNGGNGYFAYLVAASSGK